MTERSLWPRCGFPLAVVSTIIANHLKYPWLWLKSAWHCRRLCGRSVFRPRGAGRKRRVAEVSCGIRGRAPDFPGRAELEPTVLRAKWKEVTVVGLVSFAAPFLGCAALAYYLLGWDSRASWLAGVALSTTSMAVVYAVMLETRFNRTEYGYGDPGGVFITDLGTVVALGSFCAVYLQNTYLFSRRRTGDRNAAFLTNRISRRYAHRTAAIRAKWVLLCSSGWGLGALVGERGGAAGLHRRDGARGHGVRRPAVVRGCAPLPSAF